MMGDIRDVVLYNIRGNRWCGNVLRAHKSNGIFFVADLQVIETHESYWSELLLLALALHPTLHGIGIVTSFQPSQADGMHEGTTALLCMLLICWFGVATGWCVVSAML
jgi:hypothetical protein